jgi:hypothetical protein
MPASLKRFLPVLAVLAVAWVQMFGLQRGWLCEHTGPPVSTQSEHCHPVSEADHVAFVPCAEEAQPPCEAPDQAQHHASLSAELTAPSSVRAAVALPAPVILPAWTLLDGTAIRLAAPAEHPRPKQPVDPGGESPPLSVQVARCVVMLV